MTTQNIVLLSASIPTGIIALVGWLFRTYITESLKRDLERTKSELDHDLETHKKELNVSRFRYERIHEKRLEVLIQLYEKLAETDIALDILTSEFKEGSSFEEIDEKEKADFKKSAESLNDMWQFYYKNKVLFKEELCSQIDEIIGKYRHMFYNFKYRYGTKNKTNISDAQMSILERRFNETREIKDELPRLLEQIDKLFKQEIGLLSTHSEGGDQKDS